MPVTIGIPQAMLYHEFGSLWTAFFQKLNIPVCLSGETNKRILDRGALLSIDESCLPLKVYLGHVEAVLPHSSHIFIPRIVQYHPQYHFCAKFAGLPDIVSNTFRLSPEQIISPTIEDKSPLSQFRAIYAACQGAGAAVIPGYLAYRQALKAWRATIPGSTPAKGKIAVIGHSYLIKDAFFCRDISTVLTAHNVAVITPDQVASKTLYEEAKIFKADIYLQLSAKLAGAAHYFCRQNDISGLIMVSSFGCGPDSLVNEYLTHHVLKKYDKPYLILTVDEHTGSAGLITRVEAFLDLVEWRLKS